MKTEWANLIERKSPHVPEAEAALLGSIILDPKVFPDTVQIVTSPAAFYDEKHAQIYAAYIAVYERNGDVDATELVAELRNRGHYEALGGSDFIASLLDACPAATNAAYYARLVSDKARLRALEEASWITLEALHAPGSRSVSEIVDSLQERLYGLACDPGQNEAATLAELMQAEFQRLYSEEEGEQGIATGYPDLDRMMGGVRPGEFIVLAARPSVGKTSLGLNIADQAGAHVPVGFFSLEMGREALAQRLLSAASGVSLHAIRNGQCNMEDLGRINGAGTKLERVQIVIDDTPSLTVLQLRTLARRMVARHGIKLLVIDYLQLLTAPHSSRESRQVEVSTISRGIKALARELRLPILCLAQLNRESESRTNNRPRMSDLRESGAIEQDADAVLLLHREEYFHRDDRQWLDENRDKIGAAELIVAKQRNGPTGVVDLVWDSETTRFKSKANGGGW